MSLPMKTWIAVYAIGFTLMIVTSIAAPMWLWLASLGLLTCFTVIVDPKPRKSHSAAEQAVPCDCARCSSAG